MGPLISAEQRETVRSYVEGDRAVDVAFRGEAPDGRRLLVPADRGPAAAPRPTGSGRRRSSARSSPCCRSTTRPTRSPMANDTAVRAVGLDLDPRRGPRPAGRRAASRPATSSSTRTRRCATRRRSAGSSSPASAASSGPTPSTPSPRSRTSSSPPTDSTDCTERTVTWQAGCDGKVAVVTGGCSGIGLATVAPVRRGGRAGRRSATSTPRGGPRIADELGGTFVAGRRHRRRAGRGAVRRRRRQPCGSVDIAFNNAGISPPDDDSILDTGLDAWRRVQEVNLTSVYLCCKAALPYMREQGRGLDHQHRLVRRRDGCGDVADLLHRQQGRRAGDEPRARRAVRPRGHPGQRPVPGPGQHPAAAGAVRQGPRAGRAPARAHPGRAGSPSPRRSPTRCCSWPATSRASSPPRRSSSTAASPAPTSRPCEARVSTRPAHRHHQLRRAGDAGAPGEDVPSVRWCRTPTSSRSGEAGGIPSSSRRSARSTTETRAPSSLARLDGLVLAGGADVDPSRYGQRAARLGAGAASTDRDASELLLARAAREPDLPVLGICRGMQVMVVAAGGELEQHLPDRLGHLDHWPGAGSLRPPRASSTVRRHAAARRCSARQVDVPTLPPPGGADPPGYEPSALGRRTACSRRSRTPTRAFRLGVQWHPEVGDDPRLFDALVAAAGVAPRGEPPGSLTRWRTRGSVGGPHLPQ